MRWCVAIAWLLMPLASSANYDVEASTCVSCHLEEEDEELMLPVPEWRDSVHAEHEVACDACHGGDPHEEDADESMSEEAGFLDLPSRREMAEYCGACHEDLAASYQAGFFGRSSAGRVPTCVTCHMADGHRTLPATPDDLLSCRRCSELPGSDAVKQQLLGFAALDQRVRAAIQEVEHKGIELADLQGRVDTLAEQFSLRVHGFKLAEITATAKQTAQELNEITSASVEWEREADRRRRYGAAVLLVLGLLFVGLLAYRKVIDT